VKLPPTVEDYLSRRRFVLLFSALLIFYVLVPVVHDVRAMLHQTVPPLIEGGLFIALITMAVVSVDKGGARRGIGIFLGVALAALWILAALTKSEPLEVARNVLAAGFFGHAIWTMLVFILTCQRVTFNVVCASLCIYLLLGLVWALAYSVLDVLTPNAFTWTVAGQTRPPFQVGKGDMAVLYFSFATLTTLGYGDIVPTSPTSRVLASMEAIVGQLFLTVLVARLVGLQISESIEQKASS